MAKKSTKAFDNTAETAEDIFVGKPAGTFQRVLPILFGITLLLAIFFAVKYFAATKQNTDNQTDEEQQQEEQNETTTVPTLKPTKTIKPTATAVPAQTTIKKTIALPSSWQQVESQYLIAKVYRPGNWFYRIFGTDNVWISPDRIPDDTADVVGLHLFTADTDYEAAGSLIKTFKYQNGTWYIFEKQVTDKPRKTIRTAVQVKNGKSYVVMLAIHPSVYQDYLDEFVIFTANLVF